MDTRTVKTGYSREGRGLPAPHGGSRGYFYILATHFWKLVAVNLLLVVFSVPVVTAPKALCAANRVLIKLAREGNVLLWPEFIGEFKKSMGRDLLIGLIFAVSLGAAYYLLSMGAAYMGSLFGMCFFALGLLALLWSLSRGSYAFVMCAMFDLCARDILKNANVMASVRGGRGAAAAAIPLLAIVLTLGLLPLSLAALALIVPGLTQFTLCYVLGGPIQDKIISPWEARQNGEVNDENDRI